MTSTRDLVGKIVTIQVEAGGIAIDLTGRLRMRNDRYMLELPPNLSRQNSVFFNQADVKEVKLFRAVFDIIILECLPTQKESA